MSFELSKVQGCPQCPLCGAPMINDWFDNCILCEINKVDFKRVEQELNYDGYI